MKAFSFFCFTALNTSMPVIESRIDRQIWSLAQELFRKHFQAGKYEVVVEKYKGIVTDASCVVLLPQTVGFLLYPPPKKIPTDKHAQEG